MTISRDTYNSPMAFRSLNGLIIVYRKPGAGNNHVVLQHTNKDYPTFLFESTMNVAQARILIRELQSAVDALESTP